jgi:WhiB family redox-sensing transcriptional regulator
VSPRPGAVFMSPVRSSDLDEDGFGFAPPPPLEVVARGACRDYPTKMFFPIGGSDSGNRAIAVCQRCPVMAQCREYAVPQPMVLGIWGGLTANDRKRLRQHAAERRAAA